MQTSRRWIDIFLGHCLLCGAAAHGALDLCSACMRELPWLPEGCVQCGLPLPGGPAPACGACLAKAPAFTRCTAAFAYEFPVREMLLRFKQHGDLACGRTLSLLLAMRLARSGLSGSTGFVLVPMPLHRRRLQVRGFNQAERIARTLASECGMRLVSSAASRVRETTDQKGLSGPRRRTNLRGVFAAAACVGQRILIVDDVVTTGASANELARALIASGAAEVQVCCLARAI